MLHGEWSIGCCIVSVPSIVITKTRFLVPRRRSTSQGQDNVILRLEQWLQEAHHTRSVGPAPTLDRIRFCLDAVALALHGITGEVVARVVGRAPSGLQRPRRPPRAPPGSAWELVSLWTMGLRRAVAVSAAFAPSPSVSGSTETNARDRQHIRSTFDELCKALASGRDELTAAPPELVLPDIPEQLPPPPPLDAPGQQWRTWWEGLNRLPAPTRGGGALHRLRASLPQVLHALQALNANRILHNRRESRRHHQLRTFFACLRPQGDRGGGLRPELFIEAATHNAPTSQRPCESQAERLEAADQTFAWMHDEQPPFPLPRFLRKITDSMPAPRQAPPRWVVDWEAWADLGGEGWGKLTLWDRRLAYAFLPPFQQGLPELRAALGHVTAPLSEAEKNWLLNAPSNSAPDPVSFFKLRFLKVFPPRLQALAQGLASTALAGGQVAPVTTTSATAHAPKPEGGTRPLALFSELLKRTEALAAKRLMDVAAIAPPGSFLAGYNIAYTRGQSADNILGLVRLLMEADILCDLGIIWLLGDYHK